MKRALTFALLVVLALSACKRKPHAPPPPPLPPGLEAAYSALAAGDYPKALKLAAAFKPKNPGGPGSVEVEYLKGYCLAYGQGKGAAAREILRGMVDRDPRHPLAPLSQKTVADSLYWAGAYDPALTEYHRLAQMYGQEGWGGYALYQCGACLLIQRKDGDALTAFRDAAEKFPSDPMAEQALLRVGEIYLMLDNDLQARDEFQKLLKVAKSPSVRALATDELESIEHETASDKGPPTD